MSEVDDIEARFDAVRARIAAAATAAGRDPDGVRLLAVSKKHGPEKVRALHAIGHRAFGENYAQELVDKAAALASLPGLDWHFVGHLQRNKVRALAPSRPCIHALDSLRLAKELAKRADEAGGRWRALVQVNVGEESQKSGVAPSDLEALLREVRAMETVDVVGLMAIPPLADDPEETRPHFATLRGLAEAHGLKELSMGMSADLEVAIEEGATWVRVGTAIFGPR